MKAEILLILLIASSISAYTVTKFKCECTKYAIEEHFYPNYTCSHHKYNPKESSSVTGHFDFRKPLTEHWTEGTIEAKLNGKYMKIFDFQKTELCKEMKNAETGKNTNILFMACYNAAKETAPEFVHLCPYNEINAHNLTASTKFIPSFLLHGEFRSSFKTYATADENTHLCTISGEFNVND